MKKNNESGVSMKEITSEIWRNDKARRRIWRRHGSKAEIGKLAVSAENQ